ncbi:MULTISPECIES: hypothetical protein [Nocardiopsis]|uniref:Fibronectin type-III domain-containing protein n=1 Tax=Nocardiopsis sinuspersici TaxID=501010 RepID=A0A1V3BWI4_9ACTN|nr:MULTISPECIES: hypothetical protein [Nocardiopsis]OOC52881.1 hypothetical protein NOSIN_02805 [Nocardiopsis sinuspersici]
MPWDAQDRTRYEDEVLVAARARGLPADLFTRYGIGPRLERRLRADPTAFTEHVAEVCAYWRALQGRRRSLKKVLADLIADHERMEGEGSLTHAHFHRVRCETARRALAEWAGIAGNLTTTLLDRDALRSMIAPVGVAEADAERVLLDHGVRVVDRLPELPDAPPVRAFRALRENLRVRGVAFSPMVVFGEQRLACGFTVLDGFRLLDGTALDKVALDEAAQRVRLEATTDGRAAAENVLEILRAEDDSALRESLVLWEIVSDLRERPESLTESGLVRHWVHRGLVEEEAMLLAAAVRHSGPRTDPVVRAERDVRDLLVDNQLRQAQEAAADLPEEHDLHARLRVRVRQVEELTGEADRALRAGDREEAARALAAAVDVAADDEVLAARLGEVEPLPPRGVEARVDGRSVVVTWQPSPSLAGTVTYRVTRRTGRDGSAREVPVGELSGTEITDTGAPVGSEARYTVVAVRGGRGVSEAVSTPPVMIAPEVSSLRVCAGEREVSGSWEAPVEAVRVEVLRGEGAPPRGAGDGVRVETDGTGFRDTGVRTDVEYHYRIRAIYVTSNGHARGSAGLVRRASPGPCPAPVRDLSVRPDGGTDFVASWTSPPRGRVVLRVGAEPPEWPPGTVVGPDDLDSYGREVEQRPVTGDAEETAGATGTAGTGEIAGAARVAGTTGTVGTDRVAGAGGITGGATAAGSAGTVRDTGVTGIGGAIEGDRAARAPGTGPVGAGGATGAAGFAGASGATRATGPTEVSSGTRIPGTAWDTNTHQVPDTDRAAGTTWIPDAAQASGTADAVETGTSNGGPGSTAPAPGTGDAVPAPATGVTGFARAEVPGPVTHEEREGVRILGPADKAEVAVRNSQAHAFGAPGSRPGDPAPGASGASNAPGVPSATSTPGTSGAPDSPGIPGTSGGSDATITPGIPNTPGASGTSNTPGVPDAPGIPGPMDTTNTLDDPGTLGVPEPASDGEREGVRVIGPAATSGGGDGEHAVAPPGTPAAGEHPDTGSTDPTAAQEQATWEGVRVIGPAERTGSGTRGGGRHARSAPDPTAPTEPTAHEGVPDVGFAKETWFSTWTDQIRSTGAHAAQTAGEAHLPHPGRSAPVEGGTWTGPQEEQARDTAPTGTRAVDHGHVPRPGYPDPAENGHQEGARAPGTGEADVEDGGTHVPRAGHTVPDTYPVAPAAGGEREGVRILGPTAAAGTGSRTNGDHAAHRTPRPAGPGAETGSAAPAGAADGGGRATGPGDHAPEAAGNVDGPVGDRPVGDGHSRPEAADGGRTLAALTLGSGTHHVLAVTVAGDQAVVGTSVRVTAAPPVRDLHAERFDTSVRLGWTWPDDAAAALVAWRPEAPGAEPWIGGELRCTRLQYACDGGFEAPMSPDSVRVNVRAVVPFEGGEAVSAPTGVTVPGRAVLDYRVEAAGLLRRDRLVHVFAEEDCDMPEVSVVYAEGPVQPHSAAQGLVLAVFPAQHLAAGEWVSVRVRPPRGTGEGWLMCFPSDEEDRRVRLRQPPVRELRW